MIVLGIETSTPIRGVGLIDEGRVLGESIISKTPEDSERLFDALDSLLTEQLIDLHQVDGIAISIGPGSFTGLRVGLAVAKGFSMATGSPLLSVVTLDALAQTAVQNQIGQTLPCLPTGRRLRRDVQLAHPTICPILDARKSEIYSAVYRSDLSTGEESFESLIRVSDYWVLPPQQLFEAIERESQNDE